MAKIKLKLHNEVLKKFKVAADFNNVKVSATKSIGTVTQAEVDYKSVQDLAETLLSTPSISAEQVAQYESDQKAKEVKPTTENSKKKAA